LYLVPRDIDSRRLGEQRRDVPGATPYVAYRRGNRRSGEPGGRHLVKHRLKHAMMNALDERDVDRSASKRAHCGKAGEAAADDHDVARAPPRRTTDVRAASSSRRMPIFRAFVRCMPTSVFTSPSRSRVRVVARCLRIDARATADDSKRQVAV
jgi:hypothetical protein